jgi:hypothetical protein
MLKHETEWQDWRSGPHIATVLGNPPDRTAAVFLKQGLGQVTVLREVSMTDHQPTSRHEASKHGVMIILGDDEYFWIVGEAYAKSIA